MKQLIFKTTTTKREDGTLIHHLTLKKRRVINKRKIWDSLHLLQSIYDFPVLMKTTISEEDFKTIVKHLQPYVRIHRQYNDSPPIVTHIYINNFGEIYFTIVDK